MITEQAIRDDIDRWFAEPANPGHPFDGVLVFERLTPVKRGPMRLGVKTCDYLLLQWKRDPTMTMPFTSQPSAAWEQARCVGFAATKEEALALLFPKSS
jgi:hypothetical protein